MTKLRLVTAGGGANWESRLAQACQEPDAPAEVVQRCLDLGDLLAVAAAGEAQVAVVGASMHWLDLEATARIATCGVAIVGVAQGNTEEPERRLRQLGVEHIGHDDAPTTELIRLAHAALDHRDTRPRPPSDDRSLPTASNADEEAPDAASQRRVIAVWGPKGAPGRTTIAVNLAFEVAAIVGETLLVDADTYGGSVDLALGYNRDYAGLAWAARLASRGELDAPRLWWATTRAARQGPRVLTGLPRAELWTEVRPNTWEALLGLFRVAFPLTVLDLGFCLEEDEELFYDQVRFRRNAVPRLAVQAADVVVAVARADPAGLHDFVRGWQGLRELEVPLERVQVVINQVRGGLFGGSHPEEQIRAFLREYLGVEPAAFIPYDRAGLDSAALAGRALREVRIGSPPQRAIAAIAESLVAEQQPVSTGHARRRFRRRRGAAHPAAAPSASQQPG